MLNRGSARLASAIAVMTLAASMPSLAQEEAAVSAACTDVPESLIPEDAVAVPPADGALPSQPCEQAPEPVRPAGPDIFGSVAVPVRSTPFDARWHAVRAATASDAERPWALIASQAAGLDRPEQLQLINNWVNNNIAFAEDGWPDHWESLPESFAMRRGDCEDYAIAKMQLLEEAGIPASDLFLVIVADSAQKKDHAVLAVRDGEELLVLDNKTDLILRSGQIADYRPVVSFSGDYAWAHGYRSATAGQGMAGVQPGAHGE